MKVLVQMTPILHFSMGIIMSDFVYQASISNHEEGERISSMHVYLQVL